MVPIELIRFPKFNAIIDPNGTSSFRILQSAPHQRGIMVCFIHLTPPPLFASSLPRFALCPRFMNHLHYLVATTTTSPLPQVGPYAAAVYEFVPARIFGLTLREVDFNSSPTEGPWKGPFMDFFHEAGTGAAGFLYARRKHEHVPDEEMARVVRRFLRFLLHTHSFT